MKKKLLISSILIIFKLYSFIKIKLKHLPFDFIKIYFIIEGYLKIKNNLNEYLKNKKEYDLELRRMMKIINDLDLKDKRIKEDLFVVISNIESKSKKLLNFNNKNNKYFSNKFKNNSLKRLNNKINSYGYSVIYKDNNFKIQEYFKN